MPVRGISKAPVFWSRRYTAWWSWWLVFCVGTDMMHTLVWRCPVSHKVTIRSHKLIFLFHTLRGAIFIILLWLFLLIIGPIVFFFIKAAGFTYASHRVHCYDIVTMVANDSGPRLHSRCRWNLITKGVPGVFSIHMATLIMSVEINLYEMVGYTQSDRFTLCYFYLSGHLSAYALAHDGYKFC